MSTNVSDTGTTASPNTDARMAGDDVTIVPAAEDGGYLRPERAATPVAVILRIAVGCIYLYAFLSQAFGLTYSNTPPPAPGAPAAAVAGPAAVYGWNFRLDREKGFLTSGFSASPTAGYVKFNTHGPLASLPQNGGKLTDFLWMFALGGLAVALLLGIFMRIAGWGALVLNLVMWFSAFPPQYNPLFDNEHLMLAGGVLLLAFLNAGDHVGLGRWWKARTPGFLH
jgi:thiosulfate dehydrogenase [quinone] large subunit